MGCGRSPAGCAAALLGPQHQRHDPQQRGRYQHPRQLVPVEEREAQQRRRCAVIERRKAEEDVGKSQQHAELDPLSRRALLCRRRPARLALEVRHDAVELTTAAAGRCKVEEMKESELPRDAALEASLGRAAAIMARLRAPDGCPWDLEQTFDSIKRHTLEEVYEVFDAIERRNFADLKDELGDLLLQVLFYAQMASDEGRFTLRDVADNLCAKLIRRHPHVFGEVEAETPDAVLRNWEQIKVEEKKARAGEEIQASRSLLDDVPRSMPAMMEATRIGSKSAKVNFDWPDAQGVLAKVDEELAELRAELPGNDRERIESEVGDLLFSVVHLARHLKVDPEQALRGTNARFRARFAAMERTSAAKGQPLGELTADELEALWVEAKRSLAEKEGERA